jgi:putative nucleotidyltransferase with HDIG domain
MPTNNTSEISNHPSLRVLMVEDSEDDALLIIRTLKKGGYDPIHERVETATAMLQALKDKTWDIILSDYKMPHFSGEQAIGLLKEMNIDIPIIIVSGAIGEETAVECMRLGAHDYFVKNNLTRLCVAIARELNEAESRRKRKEADEALHQSFERIRKALNATVHSISMTVEMRDPYTAGHQRRVAELARSVAAEMGLSADRQEFIYTAAIIHDIGKIVIPAEILSKPTKLTALEFNFIKTHSLVGYDILKGIEFPWPVADVILQHHERIDGSGYPQGLKGADILLEARILSTADVVEAIASHRPYRPALGIDFALKDISGNKGTFYDDVVVDACLKLFQEKGYKLVVSS